MIATPLFYLVYDLWKLQEETLSTKGAIEQTWILGFEVAKSQ